MKRIIAIILIAASMFCISACGKLSQLDEVTTAPTSTTETTVPVTSIPETEAPPPTIEDLPSIYQIAVSFTEDRLDSFSDNEVLIFKKSIPIIHLVMENKAAAQQIARHFSDFINNPQREDEWKIIQAYATQNFSPDSFWTPYHYTLNMDPVRVDNKVLSLFGSVTSYAGGPHPNQYLISSTYSTETGDPLCLSDILINEEALHTLCDMVLKDLSNLGEDVYLFDDYADVVVDHFNPVSQNFGSWFLSDTGLTVYFSTYEISAYAAGPFVIEYPYDELEGIVKDEYRLSFEFNHSGSGEITAVLHENATIFDHSADLGCLILTDDGPLIVISASEKLYNVSLEQGSWTRGGEEFNVSHILFKTNVLDINSYFTLQSMLAESYPTLRIRYTTASGEEIRYLAVDFSDESICLLEGAY